MVTVIDLKLQHIHKRVTHKQNITVNYNQCNTFVFKTAVEEDIWNYLSYHLKIN